MPSNADARTPNAPAAPPPARRLGKYRIEKQLGAGGMGTVFLAVDTELRRTVALKVLPRERAANPQLVRRFKSEGAASARLEHENIVRVFDSGEIDGYLYLALEYIDGIDVQELVSKRDRLPVRRSIEIVTQVAAALQHAFERGIVHRDIKPSNLLIRKDGVVKLADMGLARAIDEATEAGITHAGMTVGTVDYISPEQGADSKQADIRSDLYSLGCSWYHMLTGQVPYPDGTASEKLRAHNLAPVPDPRRLNDKIPGAVVAVLRRLMAKRPDDRYQTPQELIDDLRQPSLLQRETGAADIAGLALAASEESPPPSRAARRGTVADIVDDDGDDSAPESQPTGTKRRRGRPAAATSSRAEARKGHASKDQRTGRELPRRADRPDKFTVDQNGIDPDQLKLAGIGLLGLIVLAAVGWGAWQYVKSSGDDTRPAGGNPFAQNPAPEPPPAPVVDFTPPPSQRPEPPPPPSISDFRPASPFPGVADAANDSAVTDVPRWVYEAREHVPPKPQIVAVDPAAPGAPRTAEEALQRLPPSGGVVEFLGRGPHRIPLLAIGNGRDVVLRAADGHSPVLLWDGRAAQAFGRISVVGGRLELHGLHIVASGRQRGAASPLITAENATLVMRNCSVTLADPAAETVPVVRLARSVTAPSRGLLENVFVRGNNVAVAALEGPGQELVAGNCLFVTGNAPAVMLRDPAGGSLDAAHSTTAVQLLASAVVSRHSVFDSHQRDGSAQPSLLLRTRHSTFWGDGSAAAALRFDAWPEAPAGELDRPRALGVQLHFERTEWRGWPHLTVFQGAAAGNPVLVAGEAQWLQFWRFPLPGVGDAPETPDPSPDYQAAGAATLLARSTASPDASVAAADALDVARLPAIPESLVARLVAGSARPRLPDDLDGAFTGPRVTIDLKNDGLKLNDKLNGPECPDGAHVVLTGTRRALIEPVSLVGKSLRIEFDSGKEPLVVEPVARSGLERPAALFHVEQGRIDLINANLRIPPSERTSYPLRLLEVVDGSFVIRNSLLSGQFGAGAPGTATVEWRPAANDHAQFGLVENSLVTGQAQAVNASLAGQLLEVRNSIIVSNGDCFRAVPAAAGRPSTLHVEYSTLSAAFAVFRVEPPPGADSPPGRLHVFVEQSVYGPPVAPSDGPVLLVESAQGNQAPLIDWWEERTAISHRITRFRVTSNSGTSAQNMDETWMRGWGPDHVSDVLYDPLSVLLSVKDVEPSRTQPADWALDAKALAATAAPDGGPLGADTGTVGPDGIAARLPPNSRSPDKGTPRPGGRRPSF